MASIDRRRLLGAGLALPLGLLVHRTGIAGTCGATPQQTAGPFFPVTEQADEDVDLTRIAGHERRARGEVIRVEGAVLDAACRPVAGVRVHLWQADTFGRYRHPADPNPAQPDPDFQGWGQAVTDANGRYAFRTIKPASYPLRFLGGRPDARAGSRTPHLHFRLARRGYDELVTQMYFAGEPLNASDGVLQRVPVAERPRVVIAAATARPGEVPVYRFDLHLARA